MSQTPQDLARQKIQRLATASLQAGNPTAWFETLYAEAENDPNQIPWALLTLNPYLEDWLKQVQPIATGKKAIAIGCGLGDDAEALQKLGYTVTAFDISPTAIAWCQQRFPHSQVNYQVADLFNLPSAWHHQYDFVLECRNVQALPLSVRQNAIASVTNLVAPGGTLLVINHYRSTEEEPVGPPWALSDADFSQFQQAGLTEIRRNRFFRGENKSVEVHQVEYQRPLAPETVES